MHDADEREAARRIAELARILAVGERARGKGMESVREASNSLPDDAVPEKPEQLIEKLGDHFVRGAETSSAEWNRARDMFLKNAGETLARAISASPLAHRDIFVMEAIVHADGSRPSFALRNGEVAKNEPFIGDWRGEVAAGAAAGSIEMAQAVGRIQPMGGHASRFAGTGTLFDRDEGLVLTNFHVIEHARERYGVKLEPVTGGFRVHGELEIDFDGEADSDDENRFRIVEVRYPDCHGAVFAGLDAAVCRIAPYEAGGEAALPLTQAKLSAARTYLTGAIRSLALVGFPAPPAFDHPEVDWRWVTDTLFGNRFGVKRLAPGEFKDKVGTHPDDTKRIAIGHDATTFGGASGSLVTSWLDDETPAFALHFGGQTRLSNYALAFARARAKLEGVGVGF